MYAVIEACGRQYRVQEGDILFMDKLDANEGDTVTFDRVLAVSKGEGDVSFGAPVLEGVSVTGKVLNHGKGKKIIVFKYRPKENYRRKKGHRQPYTRVQIEKINA